MRKCAKNRGTWRPWRYARRGAPALEIQRGHAGALLGALPQGGKFRTPFGARWQARRAKPFPRKLDFFSLFFQL
uniref:Putative ovule protein n=1 Tax=Solanum chacoense TaxID=4108 RepID=A0A0V0IP12_SOLCH